MSGAPDSEQEPWASLWELVHDAVVVFDAGSRRVIYANGRACRMYGASGEELAGRSLSDLWPECGGDERCLREVCRDVKAVHRRRDGSPIEVSVSSSPIRFRGQPAVVIAARELSGRSRDYFRAPDIANVLEANGTIHYVSPVVEGTPGDIHPGDRDEVMSGRVRAERSGEPFRMEYRLIAGDGRTVWVRDEAELVRDEGERPIFWQGLIYDISEQRRMEERLRSALNSLLTLHEGGRILSSTLRRDEICAWLLEIVQRRSGIEASAVLLSGSGGAERLQDTAGPEEICRTARSDPAAQEARGRALKSGERRLFRMREAGVSVGLHLPLRAGGRVVGLLELYGTEALAREDALETLTSLAGQAAGALENARLYEELVEHERRLRQLVRQVLRAQEEERRRVAYEVHDGLAQTAAGAHQILQAFARRHSCESPGARAQLERALELIQQTVRDARQVIADLRPTTLDDFGLAAAVQEQVKKLAGEGRQVEYEETLGDERLPETVETALYRVAQEALSNAAKHAPSARVRVTLERLERSVRLRVRDWGDGFDPDEVPVRSGPGERVGLSSMRERVALLGGRFEIRSRPGTGTEVEAEVRVSGGDG
ncbi:PAS domain S-box protein [Rubrobacter taiwanensis]|uniref:PAS domain S-box protein n=1 Tax=Rubrobacter taiwanensis TaxID=185139 RepID=A0A4R1BHR9_9ACTN|nr:PAS domain S-box protein [Rubrobacter taiwanensis]TCJ16678.1 PAS domain S-box protein [Rubrobacter taiwanensis]